MSKNLFFNIYRCYGVAYFCAISGKYEAFESYLPLEIIHLLDTLSSVLALLMMSIGTASCTM
jgi:hypothetical protein